MKDHSVISSSASVPDHEALLHLAQQAASLVLKCVVDQIDVVADALNRSEGEPDAYFEKLDVVLDAIFEHVIAGIEAMRSGACPGCHGAIPGGSIEDEAPESPSPSSGVSRAPRNNPDAELEAALRWGWMQGYERTFKSAEEAHIYAEWLQMLSRCYNPDDPGYAYEGARGIRVADVWNPAVGGSFENFYDHILMLELPN